MCVAYRKPERGSPRYKSRSPEMTAEALKCLIAGRFGELPVRSAFVGMPPDWLAALIANRVGNATATPRSRRS